MRLEGSCNSFGIYLLEEIRAPVKREERWREVDKEVEVDREVEGETEKKRSAAEEISKLKHYTK